jgi:hypothetical protein
MRFIAYVVGALVGLALLLIVGTGLAVRAWGPELARDRMEAALTATLGREAHVGRVDIEVWHGRVVLSGVTVAARPEEPGPNVVVLPRAEARIGVSSLWRRRLVLRWVRLDDVELAIAGGSGAGDVTLREIPMLPDVVRAGPVDVELGTLEMRRGRIAYEDAKRGTRARARGVSVTVWRDRDRTSVRLAADEVAVETPTLTERVERLAVEVRAAPTSVDVRRLTAIWERHPIGVTGRVDGPFDEPTVDLTVRGDVDLEPVARRFGLAWPLVGIVQANARIQGKALTPRVAGNVSSKEVRVASVTARAVSARVAVADEVVTIGGLKAKAFDGSVGADGVVDLAHADRSRVTVILRDTASGMLEALAGLRTGVSARLDVDVEARGDLRDPVRALTRARLAGRDVRLPDRLASLGIGTVDAEATGDRGTFDLSGAVARWPGLGVEARGRATLEGPAPLHVKATGDLARLAPLLGPTRAAGDAVLDTEITGGWRDPVLAGRLDVRSPAVADLRVDAAAASFALTPRSLHLTDASVRLGSSRVVATGSLAWPASDPPSVPAPGTVTLDLTARTEQVRVEDVASWLPDALRASSGPVGVTARIDGTLSAWRARGQVESSGVSVPSAPAIGEISASFEATGEQLAVPTLRARVLDGPISAKGRWQWAGSGEVEAQAGPVELARVPGLPEGLDVKGRGRVTLSATVREGVVAGSLTATADGLAVAGFSLGRGVARLSSDGSVVRGEADFPEARIAAAGQGPQTDTAVIATRVTVTDLEIEPLLRTYRPDLVGVVAGRLSAAVTLDVPARDPRAARGIIRLEPVSLEAGGEHWDVRGPVVIRREPGRLTLEQLELAGRLGTATATGRLDDGGTLEGTVRGQAPLALLSVFRPEIREASGRLDVDVRIAGTTAKPTLLGRGTVVDGVLALRDTAVVVRDIQARVSLVPTRLRIEDLQARISGGTVGATGEIALDGGTIGAYNLTLAGRGMAVTPLEGLETVWNVDASLAGRGARGLMRGDAHLVRGTYTRDLSIAPMLLKERAPQDPIEWGRELALQVDLHLDDNLVVRSPKARVRAGGLLRVRGTVAQPTVLGTIATQDGRVTFRRNVFTLENAVVRFDDPRNLNPYLDVRATTRIRTYDVTMRLVGRVDDLSIRLTSEPPLPQEDLLALVTLGATRAELGSSGGLTFAGEAAQMVSRELLGLESSTPIVDIIEFRRSEAGQTEFRVGKRLNERTTVIYSGSSAEGGQQKLRVEYQVLGPLLLGGEQSFSGGFGGDFILRLRFR